METLIEAKNLSKFFNTPKGMLHAVDNVNFTIEKGTTLGIVGESGCGKSTLGRTLAHLHEATSGSFFYKGEDVTHVDKKKVKELNEKIQFIFQDPYSSLNPRFSVYQTLSEPLILSGRYKKEEIEAETLKLMELVGLAPRFASSYPHEMDGGRRQRIVIARAIALGPEFVICDEPVSALDVSVQAQILNLLMELQEQKQLTYMFITHDLSVVRYISTKICVMYMGQVVEMAPAEEVFEQTLHPYSRALLNAIPLPDVHNKKKPIILKGEVSSPIDPGPGCRFAPRCPHATDACRSEAQPLREVSEGHFVACNRLEEIV